jgi:hypothetical protein
MGGKGRRPKEAYSSICEICFNSLNAIKEQPDNAIGYVLKSVHTIGPTLPGYLIGSQTMMQYAGGVVAVPAVSTEMNLFYLSSASSTWIVLTQRLSYQRFWTTAFLIPDTLTDCFKEF